MRRFISAIASLALILCVQPMSVNALSVSKPVEMETALRTEAIFNMQIEEIEVQANKLLDLSGDDKIDIHIEKISPIYDFAGNRYTLVECAPTGYMIYHDESGNFVESSAVATSPYAGCDGERYYGGPNEYYEKVNVDGNDVYVYTKSDETILATDLDAYAYTSALVCETLNDNKNEAVINYIERNQPIDVAVPMSTEVGEYTCVDNYKFFTKLNNCGYTTIDGDGICGYIAAGMLLTYEQVTNGGNVVPSKYYSGNSSLGYSINSSLPTDLYGIGKSLGYGTGTTSIAIHYTVEKYLANRGITANHTSLWDPIANNIVITSNIKDNRPVIWFGLVFDNTYNDRTNLKHAVVIYGYHYSLLGGHNFIAHFGWSDDDTNDSNTPNIVSFNGVLGSLYTFSID